MWLYRVSIDLPNTTITAYSVCTTSFLDVFSLTPPPPPPPPPKTKKKKKMKKKKIFLIMQLC